ncbi:ATP-binding protein [Streptomyces sp. RY43-2]|uniref:ATP-binding protein n=1 Tax=Streptomyces macrolidinus TaxID=2952607 RepID=A0ABT0ZB46_9ACTN|nr:ATP-binding protein [Streptomyces macrolidinus]MCN9240720.1 ATP-binding protein [Streptomyces macrolidinus]
MTKTTERANKLRTISSEFDGRQFKVELTVTPEQFGRIRRIVTAHVRCWGHDRIIDSAVVCATEMMTNVHKHADGRCVFLLSETTRGVRIVVSDHNPVLPTVTQPDWDSESGRGMWLLSSIAQDWGVVATPDGKDIWAELSSGEPKTDAT